MKIRNASLALLTGLLFFATEARAQWEDIIFLKNGDRISGDVKGLISGQLELKTKYMGTVFIDWEDIRDLVSDTGHHIELGDGQPLVGTLRKPRSNDPEDADLLIVDTAQGQVEVETLNVVRMYPVGGDFWDRMDLAFSLGMNYDKSSAVGKFNLGLDASYRDPKFVTLGRLSSELTTQNDEENTRRNVLGLQHMVYLPHKRYRSYFGSMEQNDQLGVDLRTLLGIGYGWVPISTSRNWFTWGVGLAANHELPFDGSDSEVNIEAVGSARYQYYKHSIPERTLDINFQVFPSLTQSGRVRADLTVDAKWEIIRDFFVGMELYSSYDSEPASVLASEVDYGVRTSLGLKF